MRSRAGAGGRHGRSQGSSGSLKLLVLVLASAGMIFGYIYIYSPAGGPIVRRQALSAIRIRSGVEDTTGRETRTHQGDPIVLSPSKSSAHQTVQIINKDDPQHPDNKKFVISQQAHGQEQGQGAQEAAKQQQAGASTQQQQQQRGGGTGAGATGSATGGSAASSAGTPGAQNGAKAGGSTGTGTSGTAATTSGSTGASGASAASPADIGSGVKATAASLQHATESLKKATELLAKQAAEGKVVVMKTSDGTTTTNATTTAAGAGGSGIGAAGATGAGNQQAAAAGAAGAGGSAAATTSPAAATTNTTAAVASPTVATTTTATTTAATASPVAAATTTTAAAATTTSTTGASPAAAISPTAVATEGAAKASTPPPDLLAYSKSQGHPGDTIHMLFTSNGSPYQNIQARIMVGTFNMVRKMPGGEKLVAVTRILHRTTPDEVMDEIPTFRANPLQPECDKWCWFPVADRANAVQQWIDAVHKDPSMVKAPWLLMLETDYVWMKPLLAKGSAYDPQVPGLAFRFDYIAPINPTVAQILAEKCPTCDPNSVPGSGPAPVLMRFSDLRAATPLWEDLSEWIETHPEAKKTLGWVREMYAWDIGVAANRLNILTEASGTTTLISQPPHDHSLYNATMFHYTWGCIVKNNKGEEVWKFDKRFYTEYNDALKLPSFVEPPEWTDGLRVHDGTPWSKDLRDTMLQMIAQMNKASATLPNLLEKRQQAGATTQA